MSETRAPFHAIASQIRADRDYAWSWHCNIAMPMVDGGMDADAANEGAARVMQHLFSVDVRQFPQWQTRRRGDG